MEEYLAYNHYVMGSIAAVPLTAHKGQGCKTILFIYFNAW